MDLLVIRLSGLNYDDHSEMDHFEVRDYKLTRRTLTKSPFSLLEKEKWAIRRDASAEIRGFRKHPPD